MIFPPPKHDSYPKSLLFQKICTLEKKKKKSISLTSLKKLLKVSVIESYADYL